MHRHTFNFIIKFEIKQPIAIRLLFCVFKFQIKKNNQSLVIKTRLISIITAYQVKYMYFKFQYIERQCSSFETNICVCYLTISM